jgi:putative transposase
MSTIEWSKSEILEINGKAHIILERLTPISLKLEVLKTGKPRVMTDQKLAELFRAGQLRRFGPSKNPNKPVITFSRLTDDQKKVAKLHQSFVLAFQKAGGGRVTTPKLEGLIPSLPHKNGMSPTVRQVRRVIHAWIKMGSPNPREAAFFAPCFHHRGSTEARFAPQVRELVTDALDHHYLRPELASGEQLWSVIKAKTLQLSPTGIAPQYVDGDGNVRCPSRRSIFRRMAEFDRETKTRFQKGKIAAQRTCEPVLKSSVARAPLEQVEFDHTYFDLNVTDASNGLVFTRVWLAFLIDRYSRAILGYYLGYSAPSTITILESLHHGVLPKDSPDESKSKYVNEWPCYGLPQTLILDNALENHGSALMNFSQSYNVNLQYNAVRRPQHKGIVERLMGRISAELAHLIPGTTFSNIQKLGDYKPTDQPVITIQDLRGLIERWIVDDYHVAVHRGTGEAPLERWLAGIRKHPIQLPYSLDELNRVLMPSAHRHLSRKGIEYSGIRYNEKSDRIRGLINRADKPDRVTVRINPSDMSYLLIEDWTTGEMVRVPSLSPEYTDGLSLEAHQIFRAKAAENRAKYERTTIPKLVAARARMLEEVHSTLPKKLKLRGKKAKALTEAVQFFSQQAQKLKPPKKSAVKRQKSRPAEVNVISAPVSVDVTVVDIWEGA